MTTRSSPTHQTRLALIQAGLLLFGENGFEATSTRDIAAQAKANIGSIAYHFGNKEGLHAACAEHAVLLIREASGGALAGEVIDYTRLSPDQAHVMIEAILERMIAFVTASEEAGSIIQFVLRAIAVPGPTLDTLYHGLFEPIHKQCCMLWGAATGMEAEANETRLLVFSMIGQVIYFRIAREAIAKRMAWNRISEDELGQVTRIIKSNLSAIIAARQALKS
ncbi:CerR family C-terminal domain-containing protein [Limoniibacter endophyticus]|uniref:TetR family transcriptional regulator n=1 Tax=Limoniibacter endophyticus TaxID=1565040 RepID=A0A8J3DND6_9HYPH|nr:CerR family C-terminal domain-containing protein [Limoniibacter endophyticus]GHC70518.1 TetR family transcriptional regulator [Limoniibacter endophyticus]